MAGSVGGVEADPVVAIAVGDNVGMVVGVEVVSMVSTSIVGEEGVRLLILVWQAASIIKTRILIIITLRNIISGCCCCLCIDVRPRRGHYTLQRYLLFVFSRFSFFSLISD